MGVDAHFDELGDGRDHGSIIRSNTGVRRTITDSRKKPVAEFLFHVPYRAHDTSPGGSVMVQIIHTTPHIEGRKSLKYDGAEVTLPDDTVCYIGDDIKLVHAENSRSQNLTEVFPVRRRRR